MAKKVELKALTIVRFFAAMGVIVYHFYDRTLAPPIIEHIASGGYVTLFFVLSGFMLAYIARPTDDRREFWLRRFARLYPLYVLAWLAFGVFLLLALPTFDAFTRTLVSYGIPSLLLVQSWIPKAAPVWNWPGWSMSTEALFFLLFPWLNGWLRHVRRLGLLIAVILFLNAVLLHFRADLGAATPRALMFAGTMLETTWARYLASFPPSFLALFVLGIALGHLYVQRGPIAARWWPIALAATLVTLAFPPTLAGIEREAYLALIYCALVYSLASVHVPDNRFTRLFMLLGHASYAMFILQSPVWKLYWLARGIEEQPKPFLDMLPYFAVLIGVSLLAHQFIEKPAADWIRRRFSPVAPRTALMTS